MPKPNGTEEIDVETMSFGQLGRRVVEGRFDGGSMTSDGGVMLLAQLDRKLELMDAAARCIADPRSPLLIKHGVRDMLRQHVYGLALGWEDLNDHGELRQDVALRTAVGVDREVASALTLCRMEKWADRTTTWRLHEVLVEQFIASFASAPEKLVWTSTPPTTRCTAGKRVASFTATTTATATCLCTCSAASNCCAPTCGPATSTGHTTRGPSSNC